jgi:SAM-dependent methyltransferase
MKADALSSDARDRITLVEADITRFALSRTFKLVIAPFRPIHHLTTVSKQLSFLECGRVHLEPGGRLVFDAFNPNLAMLVAELTTEETQDTPELSLPDGRRLSRAFRVVRKRRSDQCNDIELIYYLDGRRMVQSFPLRYFFRF